jgi:DNA-binding NarL/FixJ family response regulator
VSADRLKGGDFLHVIVASDHPIIREGLVQLLTRDLFLSVEGINPRDTDWKLENDVDVVLLPTNSSVGLESTIGHLKAAFPGAKLVTLLLTDDMSAALTALHLGVDGILDEAVSSAELGEYLRQVTAGEFAIPAQLARRLVHLHRAPDQTFEAPISRNDADLTPRETEVLSLLAEGSTNRDIADKLSLSEHTVRAHLRGIMQKLHVKNRVQAAALAWQGRVPADISDIHTEGKVRNGNPSRRR